MTFEKIPGQEPIKHFLLSTLESGRIAHAQLFSGPAGYGTLAMAIAYARSIVGMGNHPTNGVQNPDLHFSFPVARSADSKPGEKVTSAQFYKKWYQFIEEQPFGTVNDWMAFAEIENKDALINVDEAARISTELSLKSYLGGFKVLVIFGADLINTAAANKLLKTIEEPSAKTVIILVTEHEERIINTIRSRCQVLQFPPLSQSALANYMLSNNLCSKDEAVAATRNAGGNLNNLLQSVEELDSHATHLENFIAFVRYAFQAKTNPGKIKDLMDWAAYISSTPRQQQLQFLVKCSEYFRQAMLNNYKATSLVYINQFPQGFKFDQFSKNINGDNMLMINKLIEESSYLIRRNGNAKIIFTNLAISMTRAIHIG